MACKHLCCAVVLLAALTSMIQGHDEDIVKRQLRWNNGNRAIVSDTGSTIRIDFLIPHSKNVEVLDNQDYMAFTVYGASGQTIPSNTGIFHFINSGQARQYRNNCTRSTMHAGAYYYFYGKCPEEESGLIASGYCFRGSNHRGLVYNSITFNSVNMNYLDGNYYLDSSRQVNSFEQSLIASCFSSWKSAGFPVTNWSCSLSDLPMSAGQVAAAQTSSSDVVSSDQCTECECSSSATIRSAHWIHDVYFYVIILTLKYCM